MFLHFEMGKSGISIVDFRPKNVLKVDSISALGKVMGLASRVYSDFFGPHIRCGFERLKSDLDLLVDQLHGSINTSAAIELVDASIAATRDFFRYDHDATPLDASHLGIATAAAMSITADHPMVCDFVSSSLQAGLLASAKVADPRVAPADDKRRPKPAPTPSGGAAGGTGVIEPPLLLLLRIHGSASGCVQVVLPPSGRLSSATGTMVRRCGSVCAAAVVLPWR
jgi:hypothetical protein